jgi:hypothetical protein
MPDHCMQHDHLLLGIVHGQRTQPMYNGICMWMYEVFDEPWPLPLAQRFHLVNKTKPLFF